MVTKLSQIAQILFINRYSNLSFFNDNKNESNDDIHKLRERLHVDLVADFRDNIYTGWLPRFNPNKKI